MQIEVIIHNDGEHNKVIYTLDACTDRGHYEPLLLVKLCKSGALWHNDYDFKIRKYIGGDENKHEKVIAEFQVNNFELPKVINKCYAAQEYVSTALTDAVKLRKTLDALK